VLDTAPCSLLASSAAAARGWYDEARLEINGNGQPLNGPPAPELTLQHRTRDNHLRPGRSSVQGVREAHPARRRHAADRPRPPDPADAAPVPRRPRTQVQAPHPDPLDRRSIPAGAKLGPLALLNWILPHS